MHRRKIVSSEERRDSATTHTFVFTISSFQMTSSHHKLTDLAKAANLDVESVEFARFMDSRDSLRSIRDRFHIPRIGTPDADNVYLCGNSLGLQPKNTEKQVQAHLDEWKSLGVHGHFSGPYPWLTIDEAVNKLAAVVVGAREGEVAAMNSLTVNLHLLMVPFYRPTPQRHRIVIEKKAFPSDILQVHGYPPSALIELAPREGELTLRTEDILQTIEKEGEQVALVMLSGVQYYTGQLFDIAAITAAAQKKGCVVGWDLAHAVGNVELHLHDWNVDFACWCSYKYLNAGPGAIGGAFIHARHSNLPAENRPRLAGWWGHALQTRFEMGPTFDPIPGVYGLRLSNPCVLSCTALRASLEVFVNDAGGMAPLRAKSLLLTGYLEMLLQRRFASKPSAGSHAHSSNTVASGGSSSSGSSASPATVPAVRIITPTNEGERGAQLSLVFGGGRVKAIEHELAKEGVVVDSREPDVIRVAPAPLYNRFEDVHRFVHSLHAVLQRLDNRQ